MVIWNELEDIRRRENLARGYDEIRTPLIYDNETWYTSGHFPKYEDLMFKLEVDGRPWAMKAMNCPGAMLLFGSRPRSYKELPMRLAEASPLHRDELTGTLHGLLRVRIVTQDDAHIFCTAEQIQEEIRQVVAYGRYLYELFGLTASAELSTRPDNKLGTDEEWDMTEAALEEALKLNEIPYEIAPGEGAFYGPKIDLYMDDALGRRWQMGTIQLDKQMPARFGLTYVGPDNTRARALRRAPRALRLVRALHRDPDRALRGRVPVLARAGPDPGAAGGRGRIARPRTSWRRSSSPTASRSTSATRPSASGSATPRSRRSRSRSSTATRSRTSRSRSGERGGQQFTKSLNDLREYLATL